MAKTFLIKTKDGTTYGPYTMEDAKAANMASQAAMKGDKYVEVPEPASRPSQLPKGKSTTTAQPPPTPSPLPIPEDKGTAVTLPPQTSPDPLFKQKEALAKEYGTSGRGFLGGLADGLSLGGTLDDVSRVEEEGSPVAYGGAKMLGEAMVNLGGEAAAARLGIPPAISAPVIGALTGGIASAMESKHQTGEYQLAPTLGGAAAGGVGGAVGAFIGAPMLRKSAGKVAKVLTKGPGLASEREIVERTAEMEAKKAEQLAIESARKKPAAEVAKATAEKQKVILDKFRSNLNDKEKNILKQLEETNLDEIDPGDVQDWLEGIGGQRLAATDEKLRTAYVLANNKAKELADEIAKLNLSTEAAKAAYLEAAKKIDVPTGFKNFLKEYADYYIAGSLGASGTRAAPGAYERAKEEAGKYAGQISGTPVNPSIRQKQAMEALQRMAEAQAAEEAEKKKRGRAVRVRF